MKSFTKSFTMTFGIAAFLSFGTGTARAECNIGSLGASLTDLQKMTTKISGGAQDNNLDEDEIHKVSKTLKDFSVSVNDCAAALGAKPTQDLKSFIARSTTSVENMNRVIHQKRNFGGKVGETEDRWHRPAPDYSLLGNEAVSITNDAEKQKNAFQNSVAIAAQIKFGLPTGGIAIVPGQTGEVAAQDTKNAPALKVVSDSLKLTPASAGDSKTKP